MIENIEKLSNIKEAINLICNCNMGALSLLRYTLDYLYEEVEFLEKEIEEKII